MQKFKVVRDNRVGEFTKGEIRDAVKHAFYKELSQSQLAAKTASTRAGRAAQTTTLARAYASKLTRDVAKQLGKTLRNRDMATAKGIVSIKLKQATRKKKAR